MRMSHTSFKPRTESRMEDSNGRRDWRSAHEGAGETGRPALFLPETCLRCWHIATEVEETHEGATKADRAQELARRLADEGLNADG